MSRKEKNNPLLSGLQGSGGVSVWFNLLGKKSKAASEAARGVVLLKKEKEYFVGG